MVVPRACYGGLILNILHHSLMQWATCTTVTRCQLLHYVEGARLLLPEVACLTKVVAEGVETQHPAVVTHEGHSPASYGLRYIFVSWDCARRATT